MGKLNGFGIIVSEAVAKAASAYGTPLYVYDEAMIIKRCRACVNMPNAYGLTVRYAMKANSTGAILKIISAQGVFIDASSLNEARRAVLAGIPCEKIMLTTQEVPFGADRAELYELMKKGLRYNVCSLRQLRLVGEFAGQNNLALSVRIHPGVGSGESASRNTGDKYSCFGVHQNDLPQAIKEAAEFGLTFRHIHVHIGSGADPEMWRRNIDLELDIIERIFPEAETVNFGGGLKDARMPDENAADLILLGEYAKKSIEEFYAKTGKKLHMEIEPGTYITANSGYAVTSVIDKKRTGDDGFDFIILDGGMEINQRPSLYGSRHPFYIISESGELKSSEFGASADSGYSAVVAGKCCESGDCQTLDEEGHVIPRVMVEPEVGDYLVIGGAGAYCSAMTPFNYNSHTQIAEVLVKENGESVLIRKRQTLEQIIVNEI